MNKQDLLYVNNILYTIKLLSYFLVQTVADTWLLLTHTKKKKKHTLQLVSFTGNWQDSKDETQRISYLFYHLEQRSVCIIILTGTS